MYSLGEKIFRNTLSLNYLFARRFSGAAKNPLIAISDKVRNALAEKRGVVALESTVITHGLPFPENLKTAKSMEEIIRKEGSIPATIGIENGKIFIGLSDLQLEKFSQMKSAVKVSRRDLATVLASKRVGGTTVSGTMIAAKMAGIRIFATGGIGGVHRGAEETFDISADLEELGRTRVAVVCAGVKSILDIGKTLEYLETQGVSVTTFGPDRSFPGFFVRQSGFQSRFCTQHVAEISEKLLIADQLNLSQGELIACPIPEQFEANGAEISRIIELALKEAKENCLNGYAITPFVLSRLNELSHGKSLDSNIALLKNNAKIAAKIANCYAEHCANNFSTQNYSGKLALKAAETKQDKHEKFSQTETTKMTVIGGTNVDINARSDSKIELDGSTYSGTVTQDCGGVGRVHADCLTRLGNSVCFVSAIGDDLNGEFVRNECQHMDLSCVKTIPDRNTATWAASASANKLLFGILQSEIHQCITPSMIKEYHKEIINSQMVLLDGNLNSETIRTVCEICEHEKIPVWFDPATSQKVEIIFAANSWNKIYAISPNWNEFIALLKCLNLPSRFKNENEMLWPLESHSGFAAVIKSIFWNKSLQYLVLTRGSNGTLVFSKETNDVIRCSQVPPPNFHKLISESGAGDSFNSGFIHGLLRSWELWKCIALANECAAKALESEGPVSEKISNFTETQLKCVIDKKFYI